ncbi:MAG: DNA alkylation repair protein [Gemmatimonadaceae bacterium]
MPQQNPSAAEVIAWLRKSATKATLAGMARYDLPMENALGVPIGVMLKHAKGIEKDHALAAALWKTAIYEGRLMASYVEDPSLVTQAQMDKWCKQFDNWGVCDTICWHVFEKTPHAFPMITKWSTRRDEYQKRAAFALLATVALRDKKAPDAPFLKSLTLVERASTDDRNYVKKSVNWALRAIGIRNAELKAPAIALAKKLAASDDDTARWIGKDALKKISASKK